MNTVFHENTERATEKRCRRIIYNNRTASHEVLKKSNHENENTSLTEEHENM